MPGHFEKWSGWLVKLSGKASAFDCRPGQDAHGVAGFILARIVEPERHLVRLVFKIVAQQDHVVAGLRLPRLVPGRKEGGKAVLPFPAVDHTDVRPSMGIEMDVH